MHSTIFEQFGEKELVVLQGGNRVRNDNREDDLIGNDWMITYDSTEDII